MEVRIGQRHVAQRRHLEVEAVGILAGDGGAALGLVVGLVRRHQPHLLERVAAHRHAVVARHAAAVLEQRVAGQLLHRQRLVVALEPLVKARVRRHQRFLEGGQRAGHLVDGDVVLAEHLLEFGAVARNGIEHLHRQFMGGGHFHRIGDRAAGLLAQVLGAAVPELGDVQAGIEHRRRIDRTLLPLVADRRLQVVGAAHAQVVAGITGDRAGARQARVEEQLLAQLHLGRVLDHRRLDRLDRFLPRRARRLARPQRNDDTRREHRVLLSHGFLLLNNLVVLKVITAERAARRLAMRQARRRPAAPRHGGLT
ncbi:Uncharacterised protein [Achromobacter sp. 2789STDY5608615]|nr:Uncharacterised protein [Achromobacter sp. 2789STDY5608615]